MLVFHETGHLLAFRAFGLEADLHSMEVRYRVTQVPITPRVEFIGRSAGPLADAVIVAIGLASLWLLRRGRRAARVRFTEWIATCFAFNACSWLRSIGGPTSGPAPSDVAWMSVALGLPAWLLPRALALVALAALTWVVRMHPPGERLVPLACGVAAGGIGVGLWSLYLGPLILP